VHGGEGTPHPDGLVQDADWRGVALRLDAEFLAMLAFEDPQAEALAFLEWKEKANSRFPPGMTKRKARATAKTNAGPSL
jgi:hypothetical protein